MYKLKDQDFGDCPTRNFLNWKNLERCNKEVAVHDMHVSLLHAKFAEYEHLSFVAFTSSGLGNAPDTTIS